MSQILVLGSTGYAGSAISAEAASRGHAVTGVSRGVPAAPLANVTYVQGAAPDVVLPLVPDHDVIVAALSPRGDMAGRLVQTYGAVAAAAAAAGTRFVVIGGYSSLRPEEGADRFIEHAEESEYLAEAQENHAFLNWLESSAPDGLDWLFVSPGLGFSAWNPGTRTGSYRIGGSVALVDAQGESNVSGADLAIAVVDEIEQPARRGHIGVAY